MSEPCPFCNPAASRIFHAGPLVLGIWDAYPVAPGHALLITRRHVHDWFSASDDERAELAAAIAIARGQIVDRYSPTGFNIGVNVGPGGGQTVPHLHVHVIPRYAGNVSDPRGGKRAVVEANRALGLSADLRSVGKSLVVVPGLLPCPPDSIP